MKTFYVTFADRYETDPHPKLGKIEGLHLGWVVVKAWDLPNARGKVHRTLGRFWSSIEEVEPADDLFPAGELGVIE